MKLLLKKKLLFYSTKFPNNKNNTLILQKHENENKTIDNNLKPLYTTQNSISNLKNTKNNMILSLNTSIKNKKIKSSDKKNSLTKNKTDYSNNKIINSIQASPNRINKYKNSIMKSIKLRDINKNYLDNLYTYCESEPKIISYHPSFPSNINGHYNNYKSQKYLITDDNNNNVESLKEIKIFKKNKKFICKKNINIGNNIIFNGDKIKTLDDFINNRKRIELLQKLNKDEIQFEKDLNLIDNISNASTLSSYEKKYSKKKYNLIRHLAEKLIKNSIFRKFLTKKNSVIIQNGEIEDIFFKLQKYKNIIGIVESLKNKKFKNKLIDFDINSFDEYLNDEEDTIFSQSLLKINGISEFIEIIKNSLNHKVRKSSYEKKHYYKDLKDNKIKYPTSTNSFYYRKTNNKNLGYQNITNNNNEFITNKKLINKCKYYKNKSISNKKNNSKNKNNNNNKERKSNKKDNTKNKINHNKNLINIRTNRIKNILENDESSSNSNSNNISIEEEKNKRNKTEYNSAKKYRYKHNKKIKNEDFNQSITKNTRNNTKNVLIDTELTKYEMNDIYKNKNGEIIYTPHLGNNDSKHIKKISENIHNDICHVTTDNFSLLNVNNKSIYSNHENFSVLELNNNSLNDVSVQYKNITEPLCNTYTEGFYNNEIKGIPIAVSKNKKINKNNKNEKMINPKKKIKNIKYMYSYTNANNSSKKKNEKTFIKNKPVRDIIMNVKTKHKEINRNVLNTNFFNTFYNSGNECAFLQEKSITENNMVINNNTNYNTVNYFYKKINYTKNTKNVKEFTPLDLLCIFDIDSNNIINKIKHFFNKKGFLCIDIDNGVRINKGINNLIQIKLCKIIKNDENKEFLNIKIKSNDLRKDKQLIRKLLVYIDNSRI